MAQSISKSTRRQEKRHKDKNGMRVSGKSNFLTQEIIIKKGNKKKVNEDD